MAEMESKLNEIQQKKEQNISNNANNIRAVADMASKTSNPYAKAIGTAVKTADKFSRGKSSEKLGKQLNTLNKIAPGGRMIQKLSNKASERGSSDAIKSALNKKNSTPTNNINNKTFDKKNSNGTATNKSIDNSSTLRDVQDEASDGGDASFKVSFKILKIGLIVCAACLPVIIFCNLFMSASQIYIKSIGLGNADVLSTEEAESKIDKKIDSGDESLNEAVTEDDLGLEINIDDYYKKFRDNKLKKSNIVQIAKTKKRKYNEATLEKLEDFYPSVSSLSEKYDEDLVYDFFFKMYNIFTTYRDKDNVDLDLPLLMSTLMIQSDDMNEIFGSNLTKEEKSNKRMSKLRIKSLYSYDTDLSWYRLKPDNSEHDMELLAQNMVSVSEDGSYKYDENKYKEFLKQFLERKYFIEDIGPVTVQGLTYVFQEQKNKELVNDMVNEIYSAKEQYEDLAGDYEETEIITYNATSDAYWWPIGSTETTESNGKIYARGEPEATVITATFAGDDSVHNGSHGALDIANMRGSGVTTVIASKSGIVVYPTEGAQLNCPEESGLGSSCGGGYGNYVIIQHTDGNYTLYGHLYENSITVKAGDSVEQGQVIGKMGNSGNSTGTHLHFEIREGQNSSEARVDPLDYISIDNPRPVNASDQLMEFLLSWEGHTEIIGDKYLVTDIGDGVRSVGPGVTLENNPSRFAAYGIDVDDYPVGSTISISIVDQIKTDIVNDMRGDIEAELSQNSITLQQHQIDALVSQNYNTGNIVGFCSAYKKYGNTQELYNNWFFRATMPGTQFEAGLTRRRNAEWAMFHKGEYNNNG